MLLEFSRPGCWTEPRVRLAPLILLLALATSCRTAPPVRVESEVYALLGEVRAAVGSDALFRTRDGVTLVGERDLPEPGTNSGPISLALRPSGAFLFSVGGELGATTRAFDGVETWTRDARTGVVARLDRGSRERLLANYWLRTQAWLLPGVERFGITVSDSDAEVLRLALERPGQPLIAHLEIERATMRPRAFELERFGRTTRVEFEDWVPSDASPAGTIWYPKIVRERSGGVTRWTDRFERLIVGTPATFAAPTDVPNDIQFGASAALATRRDAGGRYYVEVTLIGPGAPVGGEAGSAAPVSQRKLTGWMLIDSGFGSHAITAEAADAAGLTERGTARLSGVGGGGSATWRIAETARLGGVTLTEPRFATVDLTGLGVDFEVIGVLGSPLFERATVVLDGRAGSVRLYEPSRLPERRLRWEPLARDGASLCLRGTIDVNGRTRGPMWWRVDTGSDDLLTVSRWAVREFDVTPPPSTMSSATIGGLFGEIQVSRALVAAIAFADVVRRMPEITLLRESPPGPLSDPWIAGNLGMGAVRSAKVTIDVLRGRIAIEQGH